MTATLTLSHAYCFGKLAAATRPRDRLTVSQWADRHRVLSSKQSGERGRWRTDRNPILREIMDCLSVSSPVREIVVMKSSQVGVTEASINWIGYVMDHSPAPFMVLMPTLESRDTWKVQKLNPLMQETEAVRGLLGGLKSRDAANSKDVIDFPGGILFLAGGNSPNSYAQKSARFLMMDDLDRFPSEVGEEGDPVSLARGRCKSFPRYKLLLVSTPTVKDASLIEREYNASDRRRFHVRCPACGAQQPLLWSNLKWNQVGPESNPDLDDPLETLDLVDQDDPDRLKKIREILRWEKKTKVRKFLYEPAHRPTHAWYECAFCGFEIQEHHKPSLLADGVWVPERPEVKRRGYHVSALYAPIGLGPSWLDLAQQFLDARGDFASLKTFINTNLGETWEDQSQALKSHDLEKRMENEHTIGQVPPGVLALTAFIDTQDSWLDITLLGWREGGYTLVDWHQIQGDTAKQEPWDEACAWLNAPRHNAWGRELKIRAAGVDSRGHRGQQVRAFVQRPDLKIRVYACQGSTTRMARAIAATPSYPDKDRKGKTIRGGYAVWNLGTEFCKDYLYGHLVSDGELPVEERRYRFPAGLPTEYFDGLLSEVYNPETKRYEQKKGAKHKRNEPLDGMVGAWAIGQHKEINIGRYRNGKEDPHWFKRLAAVLEPAERDPAAPPPAPAEPPPAEPAAPDGPGYSGRIDLANWKRGR